MRRMDAKVPPALWTLGGFLLQFTFARRKPSRLVRALSQLVLAASAALGIWAVRGFGQHGTTVDPHHLDKVTYLVTDGAHSISRNPMYTALIGGLVSTALWRGRAAALLPALTVWGALNTFQVQAEEDALTEAFGSDFERYRDAVPRWL